jgi:hypothetical protein
MPRKSSFLLLAITKEWEAVNARLDVPADQQLNQFLNTFSRIAKNPLKPLARYSMRHLSMLTDECEIMSLKDVTYNFSLINPCCTSSIVVKKLVHRQGNAAQCSPREFAQSSILGGFFIEQHPKNL